MSVIASLGQLLRTCVAIIGSIVAVLAGSISGHPIIATINTPAAPIAQVASSTATHSLFTVPALTPAEQLKQKQTTKTAAQALKPAPITPTTAPSAPTTPPARSAPPARPIGDVNSDTRKALVNILCTTKTGGYLEPISGSGVIIDGRGVVLTNAHVAQYFLLRDYPTPGNIDCVIRTGSPASAQYRAELLYLPPTWIDANADQIKAQQAMGTGENDYAFLRITAKLDGSPITTSLESILVTLESPLRGDSVLLASYPAGFLAGQAISANLYASSAVTTIDNIYTFTDNTSNTDLAEMGGTVVAQAGSSGGAMVRASDGALMGIITTDTAGTTTASRELRAVTLDHIDRSLASFGKGGIIPLLQGDIAQKAAEFNANIALGLTKKLEGVLKK